MTDFENGLQRRWELFKIGRRSCGFTAGFSYSREELREVSAQHWNRRDRRLTTNARRCVHRAVKRLLIAKVENCLCKISNSKHFCLLLGYQLNIVRLELLVCYDQLIDLCDGVIDKTQLHHMHMSDWRGAYVYITQYWNCSWTIYATYNSIATSLAMMQACHKVLNKPSSKIKKLVNEFMIEGI